MDSVKFIPSIPFFRIFANLFDFKNKTTKKEFLIDVFLWLFSIILLVFILFKANWEKHVHYNILLIFFMFYFNLPFISLCARRLNDSGKNNNLAFLSIMIPGKLLVFISCLEREKNSEDSINIKYNFSKIVLLYLCVVCSWPSSNIIISLSSQYKLNKAGGFLLVEGIENYNNEISKVDGAKELMPNLDEITDYNNIQFESKEVIHLVYTGFKHNILTLCVTYDEQIYDSKKEDLLQSYDFVYANPNEDYIKIEKQNYVFQFVNNPNSTSFTFQSFLSLGYNDEEGKILYSYYYNKYGDLYFNEENDSTENLKDFVEKEILN